MDEPYYVSLKSLFMGEGDGIMRRALLGDAEVVEDLASGEAIALGRRPDMVLRMEDGSLCQVQFETTNDADLPMRMLRDYCYMARLYGEPFRQVVLYIGREPMQLKSSFKTPSLDFRFQIVDLSEYPDRELLGSEEAARKIMATLAEGEPKRGK